MRLWYDHKRPEQKKKKEKKNECKIKATVLLVSYNARATHTSTYVSIEFIHSLSNQDECKTGQCSMQKPFIKIIIQYIHKCHDRCRV